MMNSTKTLQKVTSIALIAIAALSFSACKKDDKSPSILQDNKTVIKTSTIYVPSKATVYFDLVNDVEVEEAKSTINLSGMYGSTLRPSTGDYKFGYFDLEDKTIEEIEVADLKHLDFQSATVLGIDASSAGAPATVPTWIIYDSPNNHAVYPTANRFVVLYKGNSLSENADEVILFIADDIDAAQGNATYKLKIKHFVK